MGSDRPQAGILHSRFSAALRTLRYECQLAEARGKGAHRIVGLRVLTQLTKLHKDINKPHSLAIA